MRSFMSAYLLMFFLFPSGCRQDSFPSDLLSYQDVNGNQKTVHSQAEWKDKRTQILNGMQQAMGPLPRMSQLPPFDLRIRDSLKQNLYTKYLITLTVAENETVTAYLYLPSMIPPGKKLASMLVLHGTGDEGKQLVDGKSPKANRALAKELAERGYVVIAPDYPSMGEMADYNFETDRYESATMKAVFNHIRCIDFLQSRTEVDPDRVGVIGHSLGGHNAMFVGAFDERLKVVVSSCGWTLMDFYDIGEVGSKKYGGRLGPWAQDRYMPLLRDKFKLDSTKIPFDFDEVIAAIAPRPFFSNSPIEDSNFDVKGVKQGIEAAAEVYRLFKAEDNLRVSYPDAGHDFPTETRQKAYEFIDKVLQHTPRATELK